MRYEKYGQVFIVIILTVIALLALVGAVSGTEEQPQRAVQGTVGDAALAGARALAEAMCDESSASATDANIYAEVWAAAPADATEVVAAYVQFDSGNVVAPFTPPVWVGSGGWIHRIGSRGVGATQGNEWPAAVRCCIRCCADHWSRRSVQYHLHHGGMHL